MGKGFVVIGLKGNEGSIIELGSKKGKKWVEEYFSDSSCSAVM